MSNVGLAHKQNNKKGSKQVMAVLMEIRFQVKKSQ